MIAIGKLIQIKLNEKHLSVVWLSRNIPCSRTNAYKIFSKNSLDTCTLLRISQIMDFDFFQYYSDELKRDKPSQSPMGGGCKRLANNALHKLFYRNIRRKDAPDITPADFYCLSIPLCYATSQSGIFFCKVAH